MLRCSRIFSSSTLTKQNCMQIYLPISNGFLNQENNNLQNSFQKRNFTKESPIVKNLIEYQQSFFDTISYSTPVHYAQEFLIAVHDLSGLDWGSTIVLSAFLLRFTLTLPLTIYQQYVLAKFENVVTDKFPKLLEELKRETAIATKMQGWDNAKANFYFARSAKKHYKNLIVEENCHPAKASLLVLVQMPLWVSASFAVRNLINIRPEKTIGIFIGNIGIILIFIIFIGSL